MKITNYVRVCSLSGFDAVVGVFVGTDKKLEVQTVPFIFNAGVVSIDTSVKNLNFIVKEISNLFPAYKTLGVLDVPLSTILEYAPYFTGDILDCPVSEREFWLGVFEEIGFVVPSDSSSCGTPLAFDPALTYAADSEARVLVEEQRKEAWASFEFDDSREKVIYDMMFGSNSVAKTCLLVGYPGTKKTTFCKWMCAKAGIPSIETLGIQDDLDQIFGANGVDEEGKIRFIKGQALKAVERGYGWIVNEANGLIPVIQLALYAIMDGSNYFVEPTTQRRVKIHPNFRLFLTLNPDKGPGFNKFNHALVSRCHIQVYFPKPSEGDYYDLLSKGYPDVAENRPAFLKRVAKIPALCDSFGLRVRASYEISYRQLQAFMNYVIYKKSITNPSLFKTVISDAFYLNILNMVTSFSNATDAQVQEALRTSPEFGDLIDNLVSAWFEGVEKKTSVFEKFSPAAMFPASTPKETAEAEPEGSPFFYDDDSSTDSETSESEDSTDPVEEEDVDSESESASISDSDVPKEFSALLSALGADVAEGRTVDGMSSLSDILSIYGKSVSK